MAPVQPMTINMPGQPATPTKKKPAVTKPKPARAKPAAKKPRARTVGKPRR